MKDLTISLRLFYVDESYDTRLFCLSAISIRHSDWNECFQKVRTHRENLNKEFGLYLKREMHSYEFVSGHGKYSPSILGKYQRSQIYYGLLDLVTQLPNVYVINIAIPVSGRSDPEMDAWDRLLNRIERTMKSVEDKELRTRKRLLSELDDKIESKTAEEIKERLLAFRSMAMIIADEGRESELTKVCRKMRVFNPVPSSYGEWSKGTHTQNITTEHVIEDPVFKPSHRSYFVQLADCAAFALLKREVPPTPRIKKYNIQKMWNKTIGKISLRQAARNDPFGVVRR